MLFIVTNICHLGVLFLNSIRSLNKEFFIIENNNYNGKLTGNIHTFLFF